MSDEKTSISAVESLIIEIGPDTSPERIAEVRNAVCFIGEESRRIKRMMDDRLREIMTETGEPINVNEFLSLYLGTPKKYKCRNVHGTISAIVQVSEGDYDAVGDCLSANCWKPGTVRKVLSGSSIPGLFDSLFETIEKSEIREGKPVKSVLVADKRFGGKEAAEDTQETEE